MKFINYLVFICTFFFNQNVQAKNLSTGAELFQKNCSVCHLDGNNIIIPEKNLKKETLKENGMNTIAAISYQIVNGKNGMPGFGGRLTEEQIEKIANYILEETNTDFK